MKSVEGIRKHGFRKWYERQLVESHLYLVTFVLALLMLGSGLELFSSRVGNADLFVDVALMVGGAGLAWYAWRRYATLMVVAQHVGNQAVCPGCQRYGFTVDRQGPPVRDADGARLDAHCRKCGRRWEIHAPD